MIKDLPTMDKPREKAIINGIDALTDTELLAIILRTGTKDKSAIDLAICIINEIHSIQNLDNYTLESLKKIKGIGEAKAIAVLCAVEIGKRTLKNNYKKVKIKNSKDVYENFKYYFYKEKQEIFMVIFLDDNNNVTSHKIIYKGNCNRINVELRDIFKETFMHASNKIILIHNHPSNSLYPSKEDIITTERVIKSAHILNIRVLDHIIITDNNYYSFADNGDLNETYN